jgi:alpha-tubulin suppressor-like RCC1 family protein
MPQWKQYSGIWTPTQQLQAVAAGTWTGVVQPELYAWGGNTNGQLGIGTVVNTSSPIQVGTEADWSVVEAGDDFSAGIKTDGTIWSWGLNSDGRLGINSIVAQSSPVQIGALSNWSKVSTGGKHCLAIKTDGTLWAWGNNNDGRVGTNNTVYSSSPVQLGALATWAYVSAGKVCSYAIKTDGTIWSWGNNFAGGLGLNSPSGTNVSSPVQIGALTNWALVSGANYRAAAIKTDGTMWGWGNNNDGGLGIGNVSPVYRSSPIQVGALTNWSTVSTPANACISVKTDNTIWSWGNSSAGGRGAGSSNASSPVQIGALTDWAKVITSGGGTGFFGGAIKTDGTLWLWGTNSSGQLGDNTVVTNQSPIQVGTLSWSSASGAKDQTVAVSAETS